MLKLEGGIIYKCYKFMFWLVVGVGVFFIVMEFCVKYGLVMLVNKIVIFLFVVIIVVVFFLLKIQEVVIQVVSGFLMFVIFIFSFSNKNYFGFGVGFIYVIVGLVFSFEGFILGFLNVDWLYYVLIIGNYLFFRFIQVYLYCMQNFFNVLQYSLEQKINLVDVQDFFMIDIYFFIVYWLLLNFIM